MTTTERTREDVAVELAIANAAAKVTKPSPAWDAIHARIDGLLDELVGKVGEPRDAANVWGS